MVLSSRRRKEQKEPLRSEERNNINNKKETKDNEKQRFLENSDTIHQLDAHCSIDSYEHYELHGPWPHLHVKDIPRLICPPKVRQKTFGGHITGGGDCIHLLSLD